MSENHYFGSPKKVTLSRNAISRQMNTSQNGQRSPQIEKINQTMDQIKIIKTNLTDKTIRSRAIDKEITEIIHQKYPKFQHSENTCVCPSCLCGNCRCKVSPPQKSYPTDMKTIYQQDYHKQQGNRETPYLTFYTSYKGDPTMISKTSMYRDNYKEYDLASRSGSQQQRSPLKWQRDSSPFYDTTQYKRDFKPFGVARSDAIRPFDQLAGSTHFDLPTMMKTVYRSEYKIHPPTDHTKGQNELDKYKLHIHPEHHSPYMTTAYQSEFQKKQIQPQKRYGVQSSNMPLGLGKNQNFKTLYRDNFIQHEIRKCPARKLLEDYAEKELEQQSDIKN